MNKFLTNRALLSDLAELGGFIHKISAKDRRLQRARVGFFIKLQNDELSDAQKLNSLFCKLVWGVNNDASNTIIQKDEISIIKTLMHNCSDFPTLEVGCGSGRITKFLSTFSKDLTAIDSEILALQEAAKYTPSVSFIHSKANKLSTKKRYLRIFCMENMIGQILAKEERKETLRRLLAITGNGGSLVIGFRISKYSEACDRSLIQAMPYEVITAVGKKTLYGLSINWTKKIFLDEFYSCIDNINNIKVVEGNYRPAGGKMYYLINNL